MTNPMSSKAAKTPPAVPGATASTSPIPGEDKKSTINPELWQACAGLLVNLPAAGTLVYYFPQGHSEQVAASMKKDADAQIPNYPNLPSKLLCLLNDVTLHADPETDEVYAQMTLQPVPSYDREALLRSDISLKSNKPQLEFFCKTLTASDTSTHGGFSVPRRAAEKIFPPLDFSMQPPAQELVARDLHDNVWTFRHIYRGQPKRHLLTTGWSLFVSGKRLFAGDSVLFIRDEKQQLLLGIRRANRQSANLSSSVLSSDSMHIGILAAAAHAAANNSPFTVFYNPRASPSEFVIPLAKYYKAIYSNQISLGMRFRMMFETEDSGTRRYMGTITGIGDLDPVRWKNSQWRNLQVGWDESTVGERRNRVSIWDIEPVTAPFFICPPPFISSKRPRQPGIPGDDSSDLDTFFKRTMPWLGDDICMKDPQALSGLNLVQWMNMQQNSSLATSFQANYIPPLSGSVLQNLSGTNLPCQLGLATPQRAQQNSLLQFSSQRMPQQSQHLDQLSSQSSVNQRSSIIQPQQQVVDIAQHSRPNLANQALSQPPPQIMQPQPIVSATSILQQQNIPDHQLSRNLPQSLQQQQNPHLVLSQNQQQSQLQSQLPDHLNRHTPLSDNQVQIQLLQKLQQQWQSLPAQQTVLQQSDQLAQLQDSQRQILDASQSFSRPMTQNQMLEVPKTIPNSISEPNIIPQQVTKHNSLSTSQFSNPYQQQKFQQQQAGILPEIAGCMGLPSMLANHHLPTAGSSTLTNAAGAGQSVITNEVPSCSTSPSTNNCQVVQPLMNSRTNHSMSVCEDMAQSAATISSPRTLETIPSAPNMVKDLQQKTDIRPSFNDSNSKNQIQGFFSPQMYANGVGGQTDYLDTSSSTTSVGISQNEVNLQQNNNSLSYNAHLMMLRDTSQDDLLADSKRSISGGTNNIHAQIVKAASSDHLLAKGVTGTGRYLPNIVSSGGMLTSCENSKDPQQELSSSMVSQSFGVPDMTFNSIDSAINNESNFLSRGPWATLPQFQRIRTYTKVYKRGAVGRSIDMTRYSGYEELKQDLARRFGIEGQLEDRGRIGWKLVYVDHENDVLLVGDDPWDEFVNCVRCIKILSPQEVQQMSLDGDIGMCNLPNQACSSSDNGNA